MTKRAQQQTELTPVTTLSPSLENAVANWNKARFAVQDEPCREHLNGYNAATDELGQAIDQWRSEQPELFEQFGFWFKSHGSD
jgi:hypothetical protein